MSSDRSRSVSVIRLLLVEDDDEDFLLTREALKRIPDHLFEVDRAASFQDGIDLLRTGDYDVCLLDYRLGPHTGVEFLQQTAEVAEWVAVIGLTGFADIEIDRELMKAGAADFLPKEMLEPRILERTIRYSIENKRLARRERLRANASRDLALSLDHDTILRIAAGLGIPALADWSWVVLRDDPGYSRTVEVYHRSPQAAPMLAPLTDPSFDALKSPLIKRALHRGEASLFSPLPSDWQGWLVPAGSQGQGFDQIQAGSMAVVPIAARGHQHGALVLARTSDRRHPLDSRDLHLAQEFGSAIALALENAMLFRSAQRAVQVRNDFLSMVSHDLGNPLAAVVMVADRMLNQIDDAADFRTRSHLEMIRSSAQTMVRLVQDLLEVGRAEAGHLRIEKKLESIGVLVENMAFQFREVAHRAGVVLETDVPSHPLMVYVDEVRFGQVLSNLLSNAIKFTPPAGSVRICVRSGTDDAQVSVIDSGCGIPEQDLPFLFDRFWQARNQRRGGAGLGLAIAHEIVVGHGGRIWVESAVGAGSSFHFTIPLPSGSHRKGGQGS